jgi:REP element-mobilizing transposase RayT
MKSNTMKKTAIQLGEMVVMPDQLHGIIILPDTAGSFVVPSFGYFTKTRIRFHDCPIV